MYVPGILDGNAVEGEEDTRPRRPEANRQRRVVRFFEDVLWCSESSTLRNILKHSPSAACSGAGSRSSKKFAILAGNRASVGGVVYALLAQPRT